MNKEERKEYQRRRYLANKDSLKKYYAEYYEANKERLAEYQRQYRKKNKEKLKAIKKAYMVSRKEEKKKYDRQRRLKLGYGMSIGDYERMLIDQDGRCSICGKPPHEGRSLHVDHNHKTGEIRKLLCFSCNSLIGYAKENTEILKMAILYLENHKSKH